MLKVLIENFIQTGSKWIDLTLFGMTENGWNKRVDKVDQKKE